MQRNALCRSRRELSNAYFLANFGLDRAENEPCQVCLTPRKAASIVGPMDGGTTGMDSTALKESDASAAGARVVLPQFRKNQFSIIFVTSRNIVTSEVSVTWKNKLRRHYFGVGIPYTESKGGASSRPTTARTTTSTRRRSANTAARFRRSERTWLYFF